jgi:hypothetical protein
LVIYLNCTMMHRLTNLKFFPCVSFIIFLGLRVILLSYSDKDFVESTHSLRNLKFLQRYRWSFPPCLMWRSVCIGTCVPDYSVPYSCRRQFSPLLCMVMPTLSASDKMLAVGSSLLWSRFVCMKVYGFAYSLSSVPGCCCLVRLIDFCFNKFNM